MKSIKAELSQMQRKHLKLEREQKKNVWLSLTKPYSAPECKPIKVACKSGREGKRLHVHIHVRGVFGGGAGCSHVLRHEVIILPT